MSQLWVIILWRKTTAKSKVHSSNPLFSKTSINIWYSFYWSVACVIQQASSQAWLGNTVIKCWFIISMTHLTHWGRVTHIRVSKPTIIGFRSGFSRREISSVYLWWWWQWTKIERRCSMRKIWLKAQNNLNNEISKAVQLTLYTQVFCHYWWIISR